jgi:endoglucanase
MSLSLAACGSRAAESPRRLPTAPGTSAAVRLDTHLLVDQFGYRPDDPKVAVIRNPRVGYDSADHFEPGTAYEVRSVTDNAVVFSGHPDAWHYGELQASSGDSGWWFDFGTVRTPGTYFVYDVQRGVRSATFVVGQDVYKPILRTAVRMYFYQRSGFSKRPPHAPACWADEPAYAGPGQDTEARDITDRDNKAKARNLSGGWFDAGDTNKYVTFAATAVHQLLTAYEQSPAVFSDDFGIPESGNGVPDVLDEVRWETDWLKRMQYPDGSAALKVGEIVDATGTAPGQDRKPRFYVPSCTSATIAVAGMLAHAALVYGTVEPLRNEGADLKTRATSAWRNFQHTTVQTQCDNGTVRAGIADWTAVDQAGEAVVAAVYLYALTGDAQFQDYVKAHYRDVRSYRDMGWSRYNAEQGEALLYYTTLPNADAATKTAILADKAADVSAGNQIYGFKPRDDLYRAYLHDAQYHWGSNGLRANYGNSNLDIGTYHIQSDAQLDYRTRALEILHYFHGVNPFAMVYLSNMYEQGATRSANEIYHTWFWQDSKWSNALSSQCGPAPGYVPGGPNADAVKNGVPSSLMPPAGQPPQKSYRDWNRAWPQSSWAVTEPGIYYQSAYVQLISRLASGDSRPASGTAGQHDTGPPAAGQRDAAKPDSAPASASKTAPARAPAWVYHKGTFYWPGDYSFSAKALYADKTGQTVSGSNSIKVLVTGPWGGFLPYARNWDFDARGYAYLTFSLKPTVPGQKLQVFFEKVGDVPVGKVVDPLEYGPAPVVGQWTTYKIPLSDLGVTGIHIYKFAIQDETGLQNNVFYLDEIGFLPPDP